MTEEELKAIENYKMFEDAIKQTISKGDRELYIDNLENALRDTVILLNLIENLRIKNGKEFARGMETNEKLWQAKIKAKIKECEDRRFSDFTNECNFAVEKVLKELLGEQ